MQPPPRTSSPPPPPIADVAQVVILTRTGCCLCEEAEQVAARICDSLQVTLALQNVDEDADLRMAWNDHVPVTFVRGVLHEMWTLDEGRLRAVLLSPGADA